MTLIHGVDAGTCDAPSDRDTSTTEHGISHGEGIDVFVPGRLCLFGEHSDWSGEMKSMNPDICPGYTIVTGLKDYGLFAKCRRRFDNVLRFRSMNDRGESLSLVLTLDDEDELARRAHLGDFWSYVAGVAYVFATHYMVGGIDIDNYRTTLPLRKGLSSSAAVCVLVARAFNELYHLGLSTRGIMQAAFEGERLTLSQCGRMDQAVAFGGVLTLMRFSGKVMRVSPVRFGGKEPLHIVLVDLHAEKDTVRILNALQSAFPNPKSADEKALMKLLGGTNEKYIEEALHAFDIGDLRLLGHLMTKWQEEFDRIAGTICPDQLGLKGSPVLHQILSHEPIQTYIYGGKGVGSQGDGTAQILCKGLKEQKLVKSILEHNFDVSCLEVTIKPEIDLFEHGVVQKDKVAAIHLQEDLVQSFESKRLQAKNLESELRLLKKEVLELSRKIYCSE